MRLLMGLLCAGVAALQSGCVYTGFYEGNGRPVTSPYSDSTEPHKVYFPYVLKYPDETDYFIPMSNDPPHSDLNLAAIDCDERSDGSLVVNAHVRNQGSEVIPAVPFFNGFMGAFRVAAVVTTADGTKEQIDAVQRSAMPVPSTTDLVLGPTVAQSADVVQIDVIADPDRVVPDPLRDNNVLHWQGRMEKPRVQCTVIR